MNHLVFYLNNFVMKILCDKLFPCKCNKPFRYNKADILFAFPYDI